MTPEELVFKHEYSVIRYDEELEKITGYKYGMILIIQELYNILLLEI